MISAHTHPRLAFVLALSLMLLGRGTCSDAQSWIGIDNIAMNVVKRLEASLGDQRAVCSAVLINMGFVTHDNGAKQSGPFLLTDAHCIPPTPEGRSLIVDGRHAEVVKWNAGLDLAILKAEGVEGRVIRLTPKTPLVGEPVAVVGYAFGSPDPYFTFGWVSRVESRLLNITTYHFDATIISGQSGGAVLNARGELVSIVQGVTSAAVGHLGLGALPDRIREFAGMYWARTE